MTVIDDYFFEELRKDPIYQYEENYLVPSCTDFYRQFLSLVRNWELNKRMIRGHIASVKQLKGSFKGEWAGENELLYTETIENDIDQFPEFLRMSTLSIALALLENFLETLGQEVALELKKEVRLSKDRKLSFIERYLLWFSQGCGLVFFIDDPLNEAIKTIRQVRNKYIHQINKELPEQIKVTINQIVDNPIGEKGINDEFVDLSLRKISELVKIVELASIASRRNPAQ
jgi:hypothetical protein